MAKQKISDLQIRAVRSMRGQGMSLIDIRRVTLLGTSTIFKYTADIRIPSSRSKTRVRRRPVL